MDKQSCIDEVRFRLTGGVLELELNDTAIGKVIDSAFREIQRYIDTTRIVTIPYSKCIDVSAIDKISTVVRVFRANGLVSAQDGQTSMSDPLTASQWQLVSGYGNLYNLNDYMYNYMSYNTMLQMRNTTSTDLAYRYDKSAEKLYINIASNTPANITIEYIPKYEDVSEIVSDYWIDILLRMSTAIAKVTLGRIRSRYTQSNALWTQDGERILEEGNSELNDLRERLLASTQLVYPVD